MCISASIQIKPDEGEKSDSIGWAEAMTGGVISPQRLLVTVAGGINVASYDRGSERQKQQLLLLLCHCPWAVEGGLWIYRAPLLTSLSSLPPSLPRFFLFQHHLNTSTNRQKIMQGHNTHTPGSDVLSRVLLHFLCVGWNTKGFSVLSWPVVFTLYHMHTSAHAKKKVEEKYSTYKCL